MSGNNFEYSSPFLLYQEINKQFGSKYEYIWAFSNKQKDNGYTGKRVKIDSFKYFIYVLKSKTWITDVNVERGLRLQRKKQYYVNTWHGGITKAYPKKRKDYKLSKVNIFCSDGTKYEEFFTKYYKVNEQSYIRCGRPREDSIFDCEKNRESIREKYNFKKDDFIILYMPTWRDYKNNSVLNLISLVKHFPCVKVIYHSHNLSPILQIDNENILNFSNIADLNSLYAASDLLISDYSSCIYDYLLLNKPVLLYANDYDEYLSTRGLAVDFRKVFPYSVSSTEEELFAKIRKIISKDYNIEEFRDFLKTVVDINRKQSATKAVINKMINDGVLR